MIHLIFISSFLVISEENTGVYLYNNRVNMSINYSYELTVLWKRFSATIERRLRFVHYILMIFQFAL